MSEIVCQIGMRSNTKRITYSRTMRNTERERESRRVGSDVTAMKRHSGPDGAFNIINQSILLKPSHSLLYCCAFRRHVYYIRVFVIHI